MSGPAYQVSLFDEAGLGYYVRSIEPKDAHFFILNVHYARRIPSISYAFGLFEGKHLRGIVTYGTPASSTLLRGVAGEEWSNKVIELNRLCLIENKKNEASRLVGASLKMLPRPRIVVSFADTAQNHDGIVYQATNFIYTGLSSKFMDPKVRGLEHQHHATYAHGLTNRQLIEKHGAENVYFVERSRKHRYIFLVGDRRQKRAMKGSLRYKELPYPKREEVKG
jgi:hypothetical protein